MDDKKELLEALKLLYKLYKEDKDISVYFLCIYSDKKKDILGNKYDIIKQWINNILSESYSKYNITYSHYEDLHSFPVELLVGFLYYNNYSDYFDWNYKARIKLLESEIAKLENK